MSMNKQRKTGNILNAVTYDDAGAVEIFNIPHAEVDTDKFIVSNNGFIEYRTGDEVLHDIGAQGAITLTTNGTSGPSTLIDNVLNIPVYSADSPIGGLGTVNYIPKFTAPNAIGDSVMYDIDGQVGLGTGTLTSKFNIFADELEGMLITGTAGTGNGIRLGNTKDWGIISTGVDDAGAAGNLSIYNFTDDFLSVYITDYGKIGLFNNNPDTELDIEGQVTIRNILHCEVDTDKFIVSENGVIKYRTGEEILGDIGGQPLLTTGDLTEATSSVLTIVGGTGAVIGSGTTIQVKLAGSTQSGYLSSTDWNIFNNKQGKLNGTGFVKVTGTTVSYDNSTYALDSAVVHKAGTETITGDKKFDAAIYFSDVVHNQYAGYVGLSVYNDLSNNILKISSGGTTNSYTIGLTDGQLPVGTGSASTLAYWYDSSTLDYLDTATYPSLTELSYVKGVTSNIQDQLDTFTPVVTGNLTEATSSILTITGGTGAVIGTGTTIEVLQANATDSGYLSSTDWSTFNGKQDTITLTTTGTSGAATFIGNVLNIPQYEAEGNYVTLDTNQSITGQKTFISSTNKPLFESSNASSGIMAYYNVDYPGVSTTYKTWDWEWNGEDIQFNESNVSTFIKFIAGGGIETTKEVYSTNQFKTDGSLVLTSDITGLNNTANTHTFYSNVTTGGWVSNTNIYALAYFESSDVRLKNVIERNPVMNIDVDVIKFTRKDADGLRYGYSAQEVLEVAPELVSQAGFMSVNYIDLHTLKIAALEREIKELRAKLEA